MGPLERTSRGRVVAMVCTCAHNDHVSHVRRALARSGQCDAAVLLDPVEAPLSGHDPPRPGAGPVPADGYGCVST